MEQEQSIGHAEFRWLMGDVQHSEPFSTLFSEV
jgi:hypothetical protein